MTVDEVRNLIEGCKAGITYKIKNLITVGSTHDNSEWHR